jgi:arylsulfatase A-like enzyme
MNILFYFTDQMNRFALNCMGTADIRTSNLDRLAGEGVLFRNAYSNCPICTPFRINLFTGRYSGETRTFGNENRIPASCVTLADRLNAGGFRTGFVGKWHIGANGNKPVPEELRGGFREFIGYQCYNGFYKDVVFFDEENRAHAFDRHRTEVTTDLAIERLETMAGKPFALFVAEQGPHYPVQPAPEYAALYKDAVLKARPNFRPVDPYTGTWSPLSPRPPDTCPDFIRYGNNPDEYRRLYYAMVTQIDANVGRLLGALDRLGLAETTAVVFTSDHGDMQGSHGLKNKCFPHEESSGIPLIVRVPGGARGVVTDALVSGVDYFPTLLDYAGLAPEPGLPGVDFAPLTRGAPQVLDGPVFSEMPKWRMVREGNLKLVVEGEDDRPSMLFDLERDPAELENRVDDPAYAGPRARLRERLREWGVGKDRRARDLGLG